MPTTLRNVRVDDVLWHAAQAAARQLDTDLSKVTRDALQTLVARAADNMWVEVERLAAKRNMTAEEYQRWVLARHVDRLHRNRKNGV